MALTNNSMSDDNSLFDKMVEMGMGMAMASQIPKMMNQAMPNTPGSQTPPPINQGGWQIYVGINGTQAGPFNEQELTALIQKKTVTAQTLVWKQGMSAWAPASQVPETGKLLLLYA